MALITENASMDSNSTQISENTSVTEHEPVVHATTDESGHSVQPSKPEPDPFEGYEIPEECQKEMRVKPYYYNQLKSVSPNKTFGNSEFNSSVSLGGLFKKGDESYEFGSRKATPTCIHSHTVHKYGEDTVMHSEYKKEGIPTLYVIGVFDGHGNNDYVSHVAASQYDNQFAQHFNEIATFPFTDRDAFETLLRKICENVESAVTPVVNPIGGCTATIIGIIENGKRRIVFNMNMGDSHAYMRRGNMTQSISVDHSVDNQDAYASYCAINLKYGINPSPAVYSRINCDPKYKCLNHEGKCEPIPIFNVASDGCVSINTKARDYITKYMEPGGVQSIRKFVGVKDGVLKTLPGYEHINHGSTLMGGTQFVRCHGDLRRSRINALLHTPDITIYSINPEEHLEIVCGSDGLWDLFWTHEIMDVLGDNAVSSVQNIKKAIIDRSNIPKYNKLGYRTCTRRENIKSEWDDVSYTVFISPGISS